MAYTEEQKTMIVDSICKRIASGKESYRNILSTKGYPSSSTLREWRAADENKEKQFTQAYKDSADIMDDEILEIADNVDNDTYTDKDGVEKPNSAAVQRAKLRIDARNTLKAQRNPKKYGNKTDITSGGDKIKHVPIDISIDGKSIDLKLK